MPVRFSDVPALESEAVTDWFSAVTWPGATTGAPPWPPALPRATMLSPEATPEESPVVTVASPEAPDSFRTATSWSSS
jgi:hypothetical protein